MNKRHQNCCGKGHFFFIYNCQNLEKSRPAFYHDSQKLFIKLHLSMSVDAEEIHVELNQELPSIIKENEEADFVVFTVR